MCARVCTCVCEMYLCMATTFGTARESRRERERTNECEGNKKALARKILTWWLPRMTAQDWRMYSCQRRRPHLHPWDRPALRLFVMCVRVCTCVCVYMCMCVLLSLCIWVVSSVKVYVGVTAHTHAHTHTCKQTDSHIHTHTHTYTIPML